MAYCISGWPLTASKSFCQISALTQSRKRLKTVLHLPNSSGKSRQGLPVRTIHSTASTNKRLSVPLGPVSPGLPRQCGAISAYCLSLNTLLSIAGLLHKRGFSTGPSKTGPFSRPVSTTLPHGVKKDFLSLTWARKIIQKILANTGKRCFPNIFPTRQSAASPILMRLDPIFMHVVHLNFHYACQAGAKTGPIRIAG